MTVWCSRRPTGVFVFKQTATTEIYTLSLPDALPDLRETVRTVDPADMDSLYQRTVRAWGKQHFLSYEFEQFVSKVAIDQKGGAR